MHPMALFTLVTAGIFMVLTLTLLAIDVYPEPVRSVPTTQTPVISPTQDEVPVVVAVETATPTRIVIESIGVDTTITSPESADVGVLDRALQSGAVRYPGSGLLGQSANMLIFGHSSYLPVVHNKAYQAFNELGKVTQGERITVYSDAHQYTYEVTSVRMAKAEDVSVDFTSRVPTLTLATCNTFGAKEDRWVVIATLISSN
jgi:LPXTG-site transpeptidase (sortase) family protein